MDRYPISYRDLEKCWRCGIFGRPYDDLSLGQCYAPEMEKRLLVLAAWLIELAPWMKPTSRCGEPWTYLYRAVDKRGDDRFLPLSPARGAKAAEAVPGQKGSPARPEALGKACHAQYRQAPSHWCSDHQVKLKESWTGGGPPAGASSQ